MIPPAREGTSSRSGWPLLRDPPGRGAPHGEGGGQGRLLGGWGLRLQRACWDQAGNTGRTSEGHRSPACGPGHPRRGSACCSRQEDQALCSPCRALGPSRSLSPSRARCRHRCWAAFAQRACEMDSTHVLGLGYMEDARCELGSVSWMPSGQASRLPEAEPCSRPHPRWG